MNTIWSEHVQGIKTLYLSRKLRFDDMFFEQYQRTFKIDTNIKMKILEIGCGPGALAEALHRWYPNAEIIAVDRDSNFISYARESITGVEFLEGDAADLPFENNTFDVTISNTVQEHVEPTKFWGEQLRVLKPGGICLCLSARRGINVTAPCLAETDEEKEFWSKAESWEETRDAYQVCQYPMNESEIPASMEQNGFTNVTTGYAVIDLTPDALKYSRDMGEAMIEAQRQTNLEAIKNAHIEGEAKVIEKVNAKYDKRIELYRAGIKQWDTSVSVTMILRGQKQFS
jgi:ubiquinone/menaquinone biosynthesis C-methylase UbiE